MVWLYRMFGVFAGPLVVVIFVIGFLFKCLFALLDSLDEEDQA